MRYRRYLKKKEVAEVQLEMNRRKRLKLIENILHFQIGKCEDQLNFSFYKSWNILDAQWF